MKRWPGAVAALAFFTLTGPAPGAASGDEFRRGTIVVTPQLGGGINNNLEGHRRITIIPQVNGTIRLSLLPVDPVGSGSWRGSLETGLEPWFQYYPRQRATAEGLKLDFRYHFLRALPIFPYVEVLAGAGGTSLNVRETCSNVTFVLEAGAGLSAELKARIRALTPIPAWPASLSSSTKH